MGRHNGYDKARRPRSVTPEGMGQAQFDPACLRRGDSGARSERHLFVIGRNDQEPSSVEFLSRYPRCSIDIQMYEHVRSIGAVKCNGVLVTLASDNIRER